MRAAVVLAPRADKQVDRLDAWWRLHRFAAPKAFARAFSEAVELLEQVPEAGVFHAHRTLREVRRLSLTTGHTLYYRLRTLEPPENQRCCVVQIIDVRGPRRRHL
jgi:hypothetical protein